MHLSRGLSDGCSRQTESLSDIARNEEQRREGEEEIMETGREAERRESKIRTEIRGKR